MGDEERRETERETKRDDERGETVRDLRKEERRKKTQIQTKNGEERQGESEGGERGTAAVPGNDS